MSSITQTHTLCLRLLQGCSTLTMRHLKQIHAHSITLGFARFTFISSKILAFCALSPRGDLRYAETHFTHIPIPNLFDYNTIITALSKTSQFHKSLFFFNQMLHTNIRPNSHTFTALIKTCVSLSFLQQLQTLIMKLGNLSDVYLVSSIVGAYSKHGEIRYARQVFDESPEKNVVCWTSLITGYCSSGLVDEARELFDVVPQRNDVCYSAMVSGYVRNGFFNEGLELFREVKSCANVRLNGSLLVSVLNACAAVGAFEEGKWIHRYVDENGVGYDLELGTALIDFYVKCGWVEAAEEVFENMKVKDVTMWSTMILGLAINGKNKMALELFAEMEKVGPEPNAVTFVGVLTACNHKCLLDEAWRFFGHMSERYGISPSMEHYGCMVDILARSGQIEQALMLIKNMPMEPDGAIWGSLLNGCVLHGHVELGQKVGKYVIESEPQDSGRHVLMSNMYASMGRWGGVLEMRSLIKKRGVPVGSGWSFIEVDQTILKFLANENCGSYSGEVYQVLNHLGLNFGDSYSAKDGFLFETV